MERVDVRISLDTEFKGCEKQIKLVQGESKTRKLIATITEGSRVIDLDPTTEIAIIRGLKPDKTPIYNICEIIDGKVYYTFSTQDTATSGTGLYEIQIVRVLEDAVSVLHSVQFNTWVQENVTIDGEVESTGEYTALTSLIATVGQFGDINQRLKDIENEIITVEHGKVIYTGQSQESSAHIAITGYDRFAFEKCVYGADIEIPLLRYLDVTVDLFYLEDIVNPAETITITDEKQILDVAGYDRLVINIDQGSGSAYYKIDYKLSAATFYTKEVVNNMLVTTANNLKLYMQENYVPQSRSIAGYLLNNDISTIQLAIALLANDIMETGIKADALEEINAEIDSIIADNISDIMSRSDTLIALYNYIDNNVLTILEEKSNNEIANAIFKGGIQDTTKYQTALEIALQYNTIRQIVNAVANDTHYTKTQVDNIIAALNTGGFEVVEELPAEGTEKIIYLLPKEDEEERNIYEEYIWIPDNEDFEKIGDTGIDLSNYIQTEDLAAAVTTLEELINAAEASAKNASVPTSRTIAGLALSNDITKSAITQEVLRQIPNEGVTWGQYMMPLLTRYFYTETEIENKLGNYTKIYTAASMPADVLTEWPNIIAGNLINITGTGTLYLVKAVTTTTVTLEEVVKKEDVISKANGIKVYVGRSTPTSNLQDYPGITGGDIFFQGAGGTDRDSSPLVYMYYAYIVSGSLYWNEIALINNVYKKTEVNTLLDAKQPKLTAGLSIEIDANNNIKYVEPRWELIQTIDVTNDPQKTYQLTGLSGYDDIMIEFIGIKANQNGLNPVTYFWFDGYENYYVGSDHVLGRILGANELRSDQGKSRTSIITRMLGTNIFLQQTSLNVTTSNQIQYNVSNQLSDDILNKKITKMYIDVSGGTSGMAYTEGTIKVYGRNRT